MNDLETGDITTTGILGISAMMLGFMAMSLFQPSAPPEPPPGDGEEPEPPPTTDIAITGASWQEIDYPFTWYGDTRTETARFYKGQIAISSNQAVTGQIAIVCGRAISIVPLLTEEGYQQLLADLDELIAGSTGVTKELWLARKEIALQFPSVDGFWIDWRWWDIDSWDRIFTERLGNPAEVYQWDDIQIPEGDSVITVGFFKTHTVAIAGPATVTLLIDGMAVSSILSDIIEYGTFPAIRSVDIPPSVESGKSFNVNLDLYLPEEIPGSQMYNFSLSIDTHHEGSAEFRLDFLSTNIANHLNEVLGKEVHIPLDAPDDFYDVVIEAEARYRTWRPPWSGGSYYTDLPPGIYNLSARMQSWRVEASNGGLLIYGYDPYSSYYFGVIGQIEVT
ncbi:hypothetical protein ACFLY3_00625 [Chloroflexota bacterium]